VPFYNRVLGFLGYRLSERRDDYVEWEGPCGWFILRPARPDARGTPHDRFAPGLHHLAFSAASREQVDAFHRDVLLSMDAAVLDPPQLWPQYSEGYYAVFFLDPDGIKLELAHTPAQDWT
jgi:catechol 2,3-dioxygenase-like lactoylglutathione lyase family enzyme